MKDSVYQQIFQSEENATQVADQQSGSDTCTVTDTLKETEDKGSEKVQASYIYYGWNCLIYAEKHLNIYLGKDLDDLLCPSSDSSSTTFSWFSTCPSTRCFSEEFSPFSLCSSYGPNHDDKCIHIFIYGRIF